MNDHTGSGAFAATIKQQADELLEGVSAHLAIGETYAMVDFPDYSNVGDSAIWAGATSLLERRAGRNPSYVASVAAYKRDQLQDYCPDGPIFINGGGNFGDIYDWFQDFRLRLLKDFPDRPIVQLPQSIHFDQARNVEATATAIRRHSKFHLLVRDEPSLAFAKANFDCPVDLKPDCATHLGLLKRHKPASHDIFALLRTDGEKASIAADFLGNHDAVTADWIEEPALPAWIKPLAAAKSFIAGDLSRMGARREMYNARAKWRVARGLAMLSTGRVVATDRLHAMILSALLGLPTIALDNRTGKVSAYAKLWFSDVKSTKVVKDGSSLPSNLDSILEML